MIQSFNGREYDDWNILRNNSESDNEIIQLFNVCKDYQSSLQYHYPIPSLPKELDKQMLLKLRSPILDFLSNNVNKILDFDLFIQACQQNKVEILEWFIKNYTIETNILNNICVCSIFKCYRFKCINIMHQFLKNNMVIIIKLLLNTYNIPSNYITNIFIARCMFGYFNLAQWLKTKWPNIDHRADFDYAFRSACTNGYLHIAQWLKNNWPDIDHRVLSDNAFCQACENGHLCIAKWLKSNWPDIGHQVDIDDAFCRACSRGHLHIVQWLKNNWLDINNQMILNYAFRRACARGHLYIAKWLKSNWPKN